MHQSGQMKAGLGEIVRYLDGELRTEEIGDYPPALNGLQLGDLERESEVSRVACAVDGSLAVVEAAVRAEAQLLLVHHGIFWQGLQRVTGPVFQKIKAAMEGSLAIYSSHLPLDVHPQWGNNVLLARAVGLEVEGGFCPFQGVEVGLTGRSGQGSQDFFHRLQEAVGGGAVLRVGRLRERVGRFGLMTGGGGSEVEKAARAGVETLITGEGPHWSAPLAEELGVQIFYAGHYATETFGVRKLGEVLEEKYGVESVFLDFPTGL